ncbi:MAG: hypothetical protein F4X14_18335 [Caldilineaceae bacterium SB0661_bin_32]|uniref:Cytochrome c domain-containing protein n=1 Tax=Caldilineaceae bacterium SB0661_bin_32 TaxID=2605255 RepID=A0A6B1DBX1_9CHLR|nr:hypothetical protein [Caldilineaceae bacterium SB0661_bin_32]
MSLRRHRRPVPFPAIPLLLCAVLFLGACVFQPIGPNASQGAGSAETVNPGLRWPRPPTAHPDPMGGVADIALINGMEEAFSCLAGGQPVYAVLQRNANVRNQPHTQGCHLGRVPAGTLVRVEAIFGQEQEFPFVSLDRSIGRISISTPGFDEDIQPLFEENCGACHSSVVQQADLQVTEYEPLMAGGLNGPVVEPGAPDASSLWTQIRSGAMPMVGELGDDEKALIYNWIVAGATRQGTEPAPAAAMWLRLSDEDFTRAPNECAQDGGTVPFVSAQLALPASCAAIPNADQIAAYLPKVEPASAAPAPASGDSPQNVDTSNDTNSGGNAEGNSQSGAAVAPPRGMAAGRVGIHVAPFNLSPPSESDPWLVPQGGFCAEQFLAEKLQDKFSITALTFAPDGRLFIALDHPATDNFDPNILYDPFHASRSLVIWHSVSRDSYYEILRESSRVTGMAWHAGALYLNRAGEVGRIVDGGGYEPLAGGFAVSGKDFHANNGLVISAGWLYISAGGVRDGYADGIIVLHDGELPAETLATNVAAGGNPFAARIVRARLDRLLAERSIGAFQTAARGVRNPYGIAVDPFGRIWFTDNGATNVHGDFNAGDEVDLLDPRTLSAAANAGDENATPYYGFPMALGGVNKDWWTAPVLVLPNSAAPTGITWAYDTIFFANYGRDPGLFRMANAGGRIIAERIMHNWPVQAVTTAPDGAVWIGTGTGGLFRLVPGCVG